MIFADSVLNKGIRTRNFHIKTLKNMNNVGTGWGQIWMENNKRVVGDRTTD